jgi:hypothetical protein
LVPIEPTEEMCKAAIYNTDCDTGGDWEATIGNWKAMINAAPIESGVNSYVILQESPNLIPVRKGPYNTKSLMDSMLREIYKLYPSCLAIVVDMPETSYPEHGYTWLDIYGDRRRRHPRKGCVNT